MDVQVGPGPGAPLPDAVQAFDVTAPAFDQRFGEWLSVAAQRRAVRRYLRRAFPPGGFLLELGGGTGEDAVHLARQGFRILLTDGAPQMVAQAAAKVLEAGLARAVETRQLILEDLDRLAPERGGGFRPPFDGVYSNFAALNCVADPGRLAAPLARVLQPGASAVFVVFGPFSPGEILVQLGRGDPRAAFRRFHRGPVPAQISGHRFTVRYPGPARLARAFSPYFRLAALRGVGVFVPPSAAEPWISRWPRLLRTLEALDRLASAPLALLADHLLVHFVRTDRPVP